MKNLLLALLITLLASAALAAAISPVPEIPAVPAAPAAPRYAVAQGPTPVLNTPAFGQVFGGTLQLDPCGGARPIEYIALPGTLFKIEGEQQDGGVTVYRVTSNDYPYPSGTGYFVDARFLKVADGPVADRSRVLPALAELQQGLLAALGRPYVWGGNLKDGVPLVRKLYPEAETLAGVDCSGLLYEASNGCTPRNSRALTSFGAPVPIAGLSPGAIARRLRPLDLIVWQGHVMVLLDDETVIQSRMGCRGGGGVVLSPVTQTLRRLMKEKKPWDEFPEGAAGRNAFVVRRWFPL